MHWNSLQDFFAMGGYAFFVWSSVAVTAAALTLELWTLGMRRSQLPGVHPHQSSDQDHPS